MANREEHLAAAKEFGGMEQVGIARPSRSCWSAPLHMVQKKNEEWRPCGNYCSLNARMIPDCYLVKYIQDFAQALQGKKFTIIDLVRAYHQIPVAERDIPKTAITTFGMFEFPFMSFGLRNAVQTFQRFINEVLRSLKFCNAYVDDILVVVGRGTFRASADTIRTVKNIRGRYQSCEVRVRASRGRVSRVLGDQGGYPAVTRACSGDSRVPGAGDSQESSTVPWHA